jgi:hypothetical protein
MHGKACILCSENELRLSVSPSVLIQILLVLSVMHVPFSHGRSCLVGRRCAKLSGKSLFFPNPTIILRLTLSRNSLTYLYENSGLQDRQHIDTLRSNSDPCKRRRNGQCQLYAAFELPFVKTQ